MFLCGLAGLLLSPASALAERAELRDISEANGVSFTNPEGLAVDSSDDLWVSDAHAGGAVFEFNPSGGYLAESSNDPWSGKYIESLAFSDATDQLYVADSNEDDVWGLEPSGAYAGIDLKGPWGTGCCFIRVAADNSSGSTRGDLYVSAYPGEESVYRLNSAGNPEPFSLSAPYIEGARLMGFAAGEAFSAPSSVAVDSSGDLYVADKGREAVYEFKPSGEFVRSFTEAEGISLGEVSAVTVDPTNGHVLIADPTHGVVDEYSSTGVYLDNIEGLGEPQGLAVSSTGILYVADKAGAIVRVFGPYSEPTHPAIAYDALRELAATSVKLTADVKPKSAGAVSECRFEYGPSESYGQSALCIPATFSTPTQVAAEVGGLAPDTTYHYRLHVIDAATGPGGYGGPDQRFTTNSTFAGTPAADCPNPVHSTGPSASLPDCRAYELVTPSDKGSAEDIFGDNGEASISTGSYDTGFPSEGGDAFFLNTAAAFGPAPAGVENHYVFSRGSSGWQMTSLASSAGGIQSLATTLLSPDFSAAAVEEESGSQADPATLREDDLIGPSGGPYTKLFEASQAGELVGASSDLSHVVFQSTDHGYAAPAEEQLAGSHALYEYSGGHYRLVNVNSQGGLLNPCGAYSPSAPGLTATGQYTNTVSADGARVFFLSPDPTDHACYEETESGFTGTPPQLYVREGGRTIEVSEPEGGSEPPTGEGPQPVAFAGAAANGSRVFFITRGELTATDEGNHDPELYEYDVETEKLTRVSSGNSRTSIGNVGWVVPSEDGSTVYFTATGALAPGASMLPDTHAEEQAFNLYRYDTESASTTYIATVSGSDWFSAIAGGNVLLNVRFPNEIASDWQTTPDGQYLLFAAGENLTGYNQTGHSEVYRYDAADGSLICLSCNPSGAAPTANALFERNVKRIRAVRAISDDGAYAFFDTTEQLAPTATNGRLNVYEWHEGAIALISSGQDVSNSYFLGTDATGADVFFGTHARLVAQDTDSSGDLYDARIDGGFPVLQGSAACEEDACQSPPAPPAESTPASLTFAGPGNLVPPLEAKPAVKPRTNAEKLAALLKTCRKQKKQKRAECERRARERYGRAKSKAKTSTKRGRGSK